MDHEEIKLNGCTIEIHQDTDAQDPREWGDNSLFLVGYHRDFRVEAPVYHCDRAKNNALFNKEDLIAFFNGEDSENYSNSGVFPQYHIFKLEAYIHSGVRLALSSEGNFPDRRWDVSQLGAVFVSRTKLNGKLSAKQARKYALGLIEEWNQYLSGQVYGYITKDEQGNHLDSCWGFYGDPKESGLMDEARASINRYVEDKRKELSGILAGA